MVNIPPPIPVVNDEQRKQFCTKIKDRNYWNILFQVPPYKGVISLVGKCCFLKYLLLFLPPDFYLKEGILNSMLIVECSSQWTQGKSRELRLRACLHGLGDPGLVGLVSFVFTLWRNKTKETYPTRPGSPTSCKQGLSWVESDKYLQYNEVFSEFPISMLLVVSSKSESFQSHKSFVRLMDNIIPNYAL